MTSLDFPVVPEVGMRTARSSEPTVHPNAGRGDGALAGPVAEQFVEVEHLEGERSASLDDKRPQSRVGHNHPGVHLADEPGELGEGAGRVGGNGDGAQRGQSQPAQDVRRRGAGRDHHEVPVTHAGVAEPLPEPGHLSVGAAEGQRAFVCAKPRRAGVPVDGGGQQTGNGLDHGPRHRHRPSLSDPRVPGNVRRTGCSGHLRKHEHTQDHWSLLTPVNPAYVGCRRGSDPDPERGESPS